MLMCLHKHIRSWRRQHFSCSKETNRILIDKSSELCFETKVELFYRDIVLYLCAQFKYKTRSKFSFLLVSFNILVLVSFLVSSWNDYIFNPRVCTRWLDTPPLCEWFLQSIGATILIKSLLHPPFAAFYSSI